jgi:cephalosporin-C deacetylase-like acetyl esterase
VPYFLPVSLLSAWLAQAPAAADEPRLFPALAAEATPRAELTRYLNDAGHALLRSRREAVARLATRAEVEERQRQVRATVLGLLGGLPSRRTPLSARVTGRHEADGFTVENVVFESLPGFPVTANLYLPRAGRGPFPAVLVSLGHYEEGKAAERAGPDLARQGFVVLAYDPLGQGERLQHYDPELRASRAGGPTDEHGQAAARAELLGDSVARYFVWDAMQGLDYLAARPEVDPQRLGATGCSGGGTVTTYLAALDERVKAAAVSCYVTSWDALLDGPGPQEAEQSLAGFLSAGLDLGDYLTLIAPRPLLVVSTTDDFFPLAGARAVHEEARRVYAILDAPDRLAMSVSLGGHGTTREGREAISAFFMKWLGVQGDPADRPDARLPVEDLWCTKTGQVGTSLRARTVADLVKERAGEVQARPKWPAGPGELSAFRTGLAAEVMKTAGLRVPAAGTAPPKLTVHNAVARPGYALAAVTFQVSDGQTVWGALAVPEGPSPKPAVLLVDPRLREGSADLDHHARAGRLVLALEPRGTSLESERASRPSLLGPDAVLHRRAAVTGRSLVGLRAEDVLRALDALADREDVDKGRLGAYGFGSGAVALLHAAAVDPRLTRVVLQDAPVTYRGVLDHSITRDLPGLAPPSVLRHYDLDDLLLSLAPRPVVLVNPVDAVGRPLDRAERERYLQPLEHAYGRLGKPGRLQLRWRARGDPPPWE